MTPAEFKCLRESMGLSTAFLAKRWGVSLLSVQRWERNRTLPADCERDLEGIRDHFYDLVDSGVDRGDGSIRVPRTDAECGGEFPSAFYRAAALLIAQDTGAEIVFAGVYTAASL